MQSITALDIVVATGSIDEIRIMLVREQRIRELSKELFQEASYTVDVVEEVLRVCEIDLGGIYIGLHFGVRAMN